MDEQQDGDGSDDMDYGSFCCQHCGEILVVGELDIHEATGWFACPECNEMNTGD
jgi:predicted RNA-binding Zn-ribbon protein involved in translation (DUF1610 family)